MGRRRARVRSVLDEGAQVAAAERLAQLAERLGLDLTDPLTRHREALADLLQGVLALFPPFPNAEAEPQDLLLLAGECGQRPLDLSPQVLAEECLVGGAGGCVLEEIAELRVFSDAGFQ